MVRWWNSATLVCGQLTPVVLSFHKWIFEECGQKLRSSIFVYHLKLVHYTISFYWRCGKAQRTWASFEPHTPRTHGATECYTDPAGNGRLWQGVEDLGRLLVYRSTKANPLGQITRAHDPLEAGAPDSGNKTQECSGPKSQVWVVQVRAQLRSPFSEPRIYSGTSD